MRCAEMMPKPLKNRLTALAAATTVVTLALGLNAVGALGSAEDRQGEGASTGQTVAELMFPDAPYGVDPMPTGPVSAKLRQRRAVLECDGAVWPDIPAACYPN